MTRIIGIDPGGTTGVAWGVARDGHFESSGFCELNVLNQPEHLTYLGRFVSKFGCERLIIENFILYPGGRHVGGGATTGLSPVAVTYMLLGWLQCANVYVEVTKQLKVETKVVSKEFMKKNGLWFVGKQHARDAAAHAEVWARKHP